MLVSMVGGINPVYIVLHKIEFVLPLQLMIPRLIRLIYFGNPQIWQTVIPVKLSIGKMTCANF